MNKHYRDMDRMEKKVYDAAYAGWNMSGVYNVSFKGHNRTFRADSLRWLARDIKTWYDMHIDNHADDHIVVRMLQAA